MQMEVTASYRVCQSTIPGKYFLKAVYLLITLY